MSRKHMLKFFDKFITNPKIWQLGIAKKHASCELQKYSKMAFVSLFLTTNQVFEKNVEYLYDDGYKLIVSSDGLMRLHHYHDDGDMFLFGNIVFAPEISTVFVFDLYGYNFHSFADQAEFYGMDGLSENEHGVDEIVLNSIFRHAYPQYQYVRYGMGELLDAVNTFRAELLTQTPALSSIFPALVVKKIVDMQTPSWVKKHYTEEDLKAKYMLNNNDFVDTICMFKNVPDVYVDMY